MIIQDRLLLNISPTNGYDLKGWGVYLDESDNLFECKVTTEQQGSLCQDGPLLLKIAICQIIRPLVSIENKLSWDILQGILSFWVALALHSFASTLILNTLPIITLSNLPC